MKLSSLSALLLTAFALAACGGNSGDTGAASGAASAPADASAVAVDTAAGGSVCEQYEKAFNDMLQTAPEANREQMKQAFEQSKSAMASLSDDQRNAMCGESLKALKGEATAADTAEDKAEEAKEAAEEAKEAAEEAKQDAKEAAEEAKEEAK